LLVTIKSLQTEGILQDGSLFLIFSNPRASGIRHIDLRQNSAEGLILKPDSNTNLMVSRTLILTIQQDFLEGTEQNLESGSHICYRRICCCWD
jgi:hypothetical protein